MILLLKNVLILMTCVIKDDGKLYPYMYFEKRHY